MDSPRKTRTKSRPDLYEDGSSSTASAGGQRTSRTAGRSGGSRSHGPRRRRRAGRGESASRSVWTLRQRGISRPAPARSRESRARPSSRLSRVVATGNSKPSSSARTGAGGSAVASPPLHKLRRRWSTQHSRCRSRPDRFDLPAAGLPLDVRRARDHRRRRGRDRLKRSAAHRHHRVAGNHHRRHRRPARDRLRDLAS